MGDPAVRFDKVCKRFRIGETHDSLRDLITSGIARLRGRRRADQDNTFWALKDVSFAVDRGEAVGIIGPNGAGKSTALRLLAGILRADAGSVSVDGRLAALIEVGAGFHGDLTGRENIFLNGAIMGMRRREIRDKLDAIVQFAGLERFLDMPVKRYSSGMYARLGFSIASHVEPEILLVDEVLSVGDAVFRLRCMDRMRQLVRSGTTLVFVTHDLDQMQSICPSAIVLEGGRVAFRGPSRDAVGRYLQAMTRSYTHRTGDLAGDERTADPVLELIDLRFLDGHGEEAVWLRPGEPVRAEATFQLHRPVARLVMELNMRASVSENLISVNSARDDRYFNATPGRHRLRLTLPNVPVAGGQYFWNVRAWDADCGTMLLDTPFRYPMVMNDGGRGTGALALDHEWRFDGSDAGCDQATVIREGECASDEVKGSREDLPVC